MGQDEPEIKAFRRGKTGCNREMPFRQRLERNVFPLFLGLLTLGIAAAYHGVIHFPFVFDDITAIPQNRSLRSFAAALHPPVDTTVSGRPLLNLSFAVNRAVSGDRLAAYHLTNCAILGLGAVLLFGLVRRTQARMSGPWSEWPGLCAGAAALIWAVHPLQTESVAYMVQRAESLMGLFYLAVLYGTVRCAAPASNPRQSPSSGTPQALRPSRGLPVSQPSQWAWGMFAVISCWAGMATKEVMVSAPIIALSLDRTFFAGSWGEALRRRWPIYLGMFASWILLVVLVASTHWRNGGAGFAAHFVWPQFLRTEAYGIMRYLRLSFWPAGQILDYGTHWIDSPLLWIPSALIVLALGALTLTGLLPGRGAAATAVTPARAASWLGLWFFAVLAPTSLVPVPRQTLAEHRMYLALAPVVILVVVAIVRWTGPRALIALLAAAAALAVASERRSRVYVSDYSIWHDVVLKLPSNAYDQNNVGHALYEAGRYVEAEPYVRKAIELEPGYAEAWANLGVIQDKLGETAEAGVAYQRAIAVDPKSAIAHSNYASWLIGVGRLPEAMQEVHAALQINPDLPEGHTVYGNGLVGLQQYPQAEQEYRRAVDLFPGNPQAHNGLGLALLRQNRLLDARAEFAAALRLNPELAVAYANDGEALEQLGRHAEALAAYNTAEAQDPKSAELRYNHGTIAFKGGDYPGAVALYRQATQLRPDFALAHYNLGVALVRVGKANEAGAELETVVRLEPNNADAHNNYGAVLLALARPAAALKQFQIAERLSPRMPGLAGNLAAARHALHQP
jgi:tetratricopeptide (TPR) repeat protein